MSQRSLALQQSEAAEVNSLKNHSEERLSSGCLLHIWSAVWLILSSRIGGPSFLFLHYLFSLLLSLEFTIIGRIKKHALHAHKHHWYHRVNNSRSDIYHHLFPLVLPFSERNEKRSLRMQQRVRDDPVLQEKEEKRKERRLLLSLRKLLLVYLVE